MILASLLLLAGAPATPKTFEELEIAKIEAVHGIKSLHITMSTVETDLKENKPVAMTVDWYANDERLRTQVNTDVYNVLSVNDGTRTVTVSDPQKVYTDEKDGLVGAFNPKELLVKAEEKSFIYRFAPSIQFGFACDPPFVLNSLENVKEGGVGLRKAIATTKNGNGKTVTLTQWFLPDKWILKRFEVLGESTSIKGDATVLDVKTPIDPKKFLIDTGLTKGYVLQEFPDFTKEQGAEALALYRKKSDEGNPRAMLLLANMYATGWVVAKSDTQAFNWVKKAADLGNVDGMLGAAGCYTYGKGVTADDVEGFKWYKKAADAGNAAAMDGVAVAYANGKGVSQDMMQALEWFKKSGEAGYANAYYNLAYSYSQGSGVTRDDQMALKYLNKGADLNDPQCLYMLGWMYENGETVEAADHAKAVSFYRKAAKLGNPDAIEALKRLGVDQ